MKSKGGRGQLAQIPRVDLLAEMRQNGGSMEAACRMLDLCSRTVVRHVRDDEEFAAQVAEARRVGTGARPVEHGKPGSYRRCRCAVCRFANASRTTAYRRSSNGGTCPGCGRRIGTRGGEFYAHHSSPGVLCARGTIPSGGVQTAPLPPQPKSEVDGRRDWTLTERVEQEIAKGTPTVGIMSRLDIDYATVKSVRDDMAAVERASGGAA